MGHETCEGCAEIDAEPACGRSHWGLGLATEVLRGLLTIAFETLGCYRVEGNCAVDHTASGRVMAKVGMQREGILRGKLPVGAVHHDLQYYAMLRGEYPRWRERWRSLGQV